LLNHAEQVSKLSNPSAKVIKPSENGTLLEIELPTVRVHAKQLVLRDSAVVTAQAGARRQRQRTTTRAHAHTDSCRETRHAIVGTPLSRRALFQETSSISFLAFPRIQRAQCEHDMLAAAGHKFWTANPPSAQRYSNVCDTQAHAINTSSNIAKSTLRAHLETV
jgi:hypothetical protein